MGGVYGRKGEKSGALLEFRVDPEDSEAQECLPAKRRPAIGRKMKNLARERQEELTGQDRREGILYLVLSRQIKVVQLFFDSVFVRDAEVGEKSLRREASAAEGHATQRNSLKPSVFTVFMARPSRASHRAIRRGRRAWRSRRPPEPSVI